MIILLFDYHDLVGVARTCSIGEYVLEVDPPDISFTLPEAALYTEVLAPTSAGAVVG